MVFVRENPIKMDDLGVPLFQETTIKLYQFFRPKAITSTNQIGLAMLALLQERSEICESNRNQILLQSRPKKTSANPKRTVL